MNQRKIEKTVTLVEHSNGGKSLKVGDQTILRISKAEDKKVVIYVESGEDLEITRPTESEVSHPKPKLNDEEFLEVVEVFRILKRWRDEKKIFLGE